MESVQQIQQSGDVLFLTLGAVMVLSMHAGFAFLEVGTVRKKNQVNALAKIICDFALATLAYIFVGYFIAYGLHFFHPVSELSLGSGYDMVKLSFL